MRIKKNSIANKTKNKKKLLKNPELTLLTRHRNNQIERKQKNNNKVQRQIIPCKIMKLKKKTHKKIKKKIRLSKEEISKNYKVK